MPHITTSMQRSVRRGIGEILFDSLLGKRGITDEVNNVKDSFSSWDNCMNATYCKWPVIAAIIIGGLILLSIVTCIGRCCDCCGDSCAGKKDKPMKHQDSPFHPAQPQQGYQGYQAPAPMMGGALPAAGAPMNVASTQPTPPQYAQFEVGKNGLYVEPKVVPLNEDALPPMPSWDAASKKHIPEEEKNAVELGELDPATGQKMPLMAAAAVAGTSVPPSPDVGQGQTPFGARPGAGNNGYMGVAGDNQGQAAFNGNGRYGSPAPGQGRGGYGGRSPQGYDGQGRGFGQDVYDAPEVYDSQGRGYGSPAPQDPYSQNNGFDGAAVGGYGGRQPQGQYANDQYSDGGRPFPPPNRQYSSDSSRPLGPGRQYTDRSYGSDNMQGGGPPRGPSRGPGPNGPPRGPSRGPGPNDQYGPPRGPSRGPGGPMRTGSPALNNNAGFDFGGGAPSYQSRQSPPQQGYGRPPPQTENSDYFGNVGTAAPSYASRSPPPQEPAYPGYKAYQPGNQDRGIPQALSPGEGRGREPQRWDPVQQ